MYELLNIKWGESTYGTASGPVTWSADLDGLDIADGADLDDIMTSLNSAFQTWENVAALEFVETSGSADISISYASFSTDGDSANDGAAGTASWTPTGSGLNEPTNVEIEFNSDYEWSPFEDAVSSTVNFFAVAAHEIGHVIGLDHPWDIGDPLSERDDSLIMNAILTSNSLGEGDIAGAQAIYGLDAGDEPAEGVDEGSLAAADDGGSGGAGVGILLGLLALVFGLFSGGLGAAAVMAAGTVATEDDDELAEDDHDHDDDHDDEDDYGHDHGDGNFHVLYLPTVPVNETEHHHHADDDEDDVFLL